MVRSVGWFNLKHRLSFSRHHMGVSPRTRGSKPPYKSANPGGQDHSHSPDRARKLAFWPCVSFVATKSQRATGECAKKEDDECDREEGQQAPKFWLPSVAVPKPLPAAANRGSGDLIVVTKDPCSSGRTQCSPCWLPEKAEFQPPPVSHLQRPCSCSSLGPRLARQ